ncbi:MAG: hypothetical protein EBZ47_10650, partial [Chlamydiae bacterium]|nr:hypothetical protein [Chlamydiota bacterium]
EKDSRLNPEILTKLQSYIKAVADKNGCPLFLHMETTKRSEAVLRMKETIPLNRDTISFIKTITKEEGIRIEYR